jgi:hypothetical protein
VVIAIDENEGCHEEEGEGREGLEVGGRPAGQKVRRGWRQLAGMKGGGGWQAKARQARATESERGRGDRSRGAIGCLIASVSLKTIFQNV